MKDFRRCVDSIKNFTFVISPFDVPDLADVNIYSLSFKNRKGSINDKLELYMLLDPKTKMDNITDENKRI